MSVSWSCYIDDCRSEATYVVHSYPDTVRLCDRHKSLHPVEVGERLCVGAGCDLCDDDASEYLSP
jgi:hypothetical protein